MASFTVIIAFQLFHFKTGTFHRSFHLELNTGLSAKPQDFLASTEVNDNIAMNLGPRCAVRSAAEAEEGLRDIWMSGNTCRMLGASPHAVPEERGRERDASKMHRTSEGCWR